MTNQETIGQPRRLDRGQQVKNFIRYSITEGLKDVSAQVQDEAVKEGK